MNMLTPHILPIKKSQIFYDVKLVKCGSDASKKLNDMQSTQWTENSWNMVSQNIFSSGQSLSLILIPWMYFANMADNTAHIMVTMADYMYSIRRN